jgi:hypothetical protein
LNGRLRPSRAVQYIPDMANDNEIDITTRLTDAAHDPDMPEPLIALLLEAVETIVILRTLVGIRDEIEKEE